MCLLRRAAPFASRREPALLVSFTLTFSYLVESGALFRIGLVLFPLALR